MGGHSTVCSPPILSRSSGMLNRRVVVANSLDPVVAELLFSSLVSLPWCGFMIYSIHKRYENRYISKFRDEMIGLGFLWLFWMVGTGIATSTWVNIAWCQHINACRVLSALLAFAWLGWIALTALLAICLLFTIANHAFLEPLHGRWDPRQTVYA
ncbi:hypothetical protein FA13DRAFT_1742944 [Coprinellus micaceus]|uniref:MARVEL domain-containing protein n=1 Tax=Coprinellus micaceus TaxID=71717 RepID=A0A4Y7SG25_COPMI|nr:hypothetical protein FA13DRAFT_1749852 [Coprinellus micaceus]TEB09638.1 hypothetical protein FA13DRAFT_1749258 [Coprinellus micaceus]TEB20472.1 hypothetical protein FA13DRAFT_1742944 [Coprinellus micaceus]